MNDWIDAETFVENAHKAYEEGRWDEAAKALRDALALNPYRAEWHFNLGLTLEAAGRFDEAARAFADCHDIDPSDPETKVVVGVNLLRADKPSESIRWFEEAYALDPTISAALVHRIEAYARLGDHDQAEVMFYLAQQINPKDAGAFANLAESLITRAVYDKAVWCLRQAAHLEPNLPHVHARLAHAYACTGRLDRARALYFRQLRADPGDTDTLLDLGCLLVRMNRPAEAEEKFRRILELNPDDPDAHFHLAETAERRGQSAAALDKYGVVLRLDPDTVGVRPRIAAILLARNSGGERGADAERARARLREELAALDGSPDRFRPDDIRHLARTMLGAGLPALARRVLGPFAKANGRDAEALHLLSVALYRLRDRPAAMALGRRALRVRPDLFPALFNLAVACIESREWARARVYINRALEANPDDPALRRMLAGVRLRSLVARAAGLFRPFGRA